MGRAVVPSDFALKAMNASHRAAIWLSRGKAGWNANGMPVLELTTIGRKSGEKRSVMLTSPTRDGESWVIVASRGGDDALSGTEPDNLSSLSVSPKGMVAKYTRSARRERGAPRRC